MKHARELLLEAMFETLAMSEIHEAAIRGWESAAKKEIGEFKQLAEYNITRWRKAEDHNKKAMLLLGKLSGPISEIPIP